MAASSGRRANGLYTEDGVLDGTTPTLHRFVDGDLQRVELTPNALTQASGGAAQSGAVGRAPRGGGTSEDAVPAEPAAPEEIPDMSEPEIFLPELP